LYHKNPDCRASLRLKQFAGQKIVFQAIFGGFMREAQQTAGTRGANIRLTNQTLGENRQFFAV
jgi:hypothetical protein